MSAFIHKWANWSGNNSASSSKDLTLPKLTEPKSSAPISDLKNVGSTNSPIKSMNTMPASFSPSNALPPVSNQAAAVSAASGDVSTTASSKEHAKMAMYEKLAMVLDLLQSGSISSNILNMRPR
jgi:hypothetical protein